MVELRCVCLDLKFADLLRIARQRGITCAQELSVITGCGSKCGACLPLIDDLLRTGKVHISGVEFPFPEPTDAPDSPDSSDD